MGGVAAGQSQCKSQASADRRLDHRARPLPRRHGLEEMASLPIPDELLAEILLCLPTPADVIRASGACVAFRRLVAGRAFLRRFRELHAPPLLGFLAQSRVFFPLTPHHPSAPAASAAAIATDFSFSFLPGHARDYEVRDVRGGRVLLTTRPTSDNPSLVVCDPLHRQYLLLPPIPSAEGWVPRSPDSRQSFLGDDEEAAGENTSPFTVITSAQCGNKQAAVVFSSSTGQWRATPWTTGSASFSHRRYAYGCFYGVTDCRSKLLVLDTRMKEELSLAVADLPPEARGYSGAGQDVDIAIVEAGEGITGMFVHERYTSNISCLIKRNNGGSSGRWQLEKTIPLASSGYFFTGSSGRYLLLYHWGSTLMEPGTFTLDIRTFQLEKVFASESGKYVYSNFPPSLLSSSTI